MSIIFKQLVLLIILIERGESLNLVAYISQYGLHGEIYFSNYSPHKTKISTSLETTLQYPEQAWSWGVYEFPVDYTNVYEESRCDVANLGEQIWSFDDELGYLEMPGNESVSWLNDIKLTGPKGLWGKTLVLYNAELTHRICATITTKDPSQEHIAEARFFNPVAGSIYFRWLAAKDFSDTLIYSDLYYMHDQAISHLEDDMTFTENAWKIYATDIFEGDASKADENCNKLQLVFDPSNRGQGRAIGDIDLRLGPIRISIEHQKHKVRQLFNDMALALLPSDLNGPSRKLYMVIFDPTKPFAFLGCARIRHLKPRTGVAIVNGGGIKGEIRFTQRSKFEPTWINFQVASASNSSQDNYEYARNIAYFRINSLPLDPSLANDGFYCASSGKMLNPFNIDRSTGPPPGLGTQDQYAVGDLTGKLLNRNKNEKHNYLLPGESTELSGSYWDLFLPLQGLNSIIHRGMSIFRYDRSDPNDVNSQPIWTCSTIALYENNRNYQVPMATAQIIFRYPIVGKVILRQPMDEYWADTTIIFEYLIHADGSTQMNTFDHRWAIHENPPGNDFYEWQNRCTSVGNIYNPHHVQFTNKSFGDLCNYFSDKQCRLGDLSNRIGLLTVAGSKFWAPERSRKMFVEQNLPLSGPAKIIGKSLVIYDDYGPVARGERLACAKIELYHRRKAVAKDWFPNGDDETTMSGKIEIVQQTQYDLTNIEVDFKGLEDNSQYHIHALPVEQELEFPCESSTLFGNWNPRKIDPDHSPLPAAGSSDQYEIGDLSGKFGTLDGISRFGSAFNDTHLPLFGYESIIGRSVVIHKKDKNRRWACSSIERGYSPNEAREIRAIASFHHPSGFAYGYIRLTQLIARDGTQSETIIEAKLRHPGKNDRNVTTNHIWQIWANGVGVDATVKDTQTRCVAAGYIWNPYFTQLADPLNQELYNKECGFDNPYRCYVGDVSARVGLLDIGGKRVVYTDDNFPLEGTVSAVGKAIVILGPNFARDRFACANIERDHDIVKYVNLNKPPRFVVAQFLEDVRRVMGVPEWMLAIDSRSTKTLHNGGCVQMIVHFKGPQAHKLEQEFTKLLASGRQENPSLFIPGYFDAKRKKTLSYRTCGTREPSEQLLISDKSYRTFGFGKETGAGDRLLPYRILIIPILLRCILF